MKSVGLTKYLPGVEHATDDPAILKEVADYYALPSKLRSKQLRVASNCNPMTPTLEKNSPPVLFWIKPTREAVEMLEENLRQHPEISALRSACSGLRRSSAGVPGENRVRSESCLFEAAANYEQSLLINPDHAITYVRLAELLLARSKMLSARSQLLTERAVIFRMLLRWPITWGWRYGRLNIRNRPSLLFEEALHESELEGGEIATARFYLISARPPNKQGCMKGGDLFKRSIAIGPGQRRRSLQLPWIYVG